MHRRRTPLPLSLTVSVVALACMLLAPAGAAARRNRSGERSSPAALPQESQESTSPTEPKLPGEEPTSHESESPGAGESGPGASGESQRGSRDGRAHGCSTSVTVSSAVTTAGQPLTLSGQLSCREGSVADAPVTIYVRGRADRGIAGAEEVGVATTETDGSYTFATSAPSHNFTFVVRGPSGRGAHVNVKVEPLVELSGPPAEATAAAGGRRAGRGRQQWTFSGSVDPAVSGTRVVLQREYPTEQERWHTFAVGVVGVDGRFSIVHALPARGNVSVRAVAHVKGDLAAASEPLSFAITATQNPQLTISASSAAVSSGQPVTISGVAAGAGAQEVALLARTAGGAFVAVAHDTTGAGGEYTFTVTPTQRTDYRVSSAAEQSSVLLEGFKYLLTAEPAPTTIAAGARLSFAGTVVGAPAGQPVYLERENGPGPSFHVIASASVSADSSYSIPYAFGRRATAVLRIRVPADSVSDGSTSEPFTVGVSGEEPAGAPAS